MINNWSYAMEIGGGGEWKTRLTFVDGPERGGGGGLACTPNFLIFKSTNLNNFSSSQYINTYISTKFNYYTTLTNPFILHYAFITIIVNDGKWGWVIK